MLSSGSRSIDVGFDGCYVEMPELLNGLSDGMHVPLDVLLPLIVHGVLALFGTCLVVLMKQIEWGARMDQRGVTPAVHI